MDNPPPIGPLNPRWGRYIRNPQPIGKGFFLVEAQRGKGGTGKVWYPAIVRRNPRYVPGTEGDWRTGSEWQLCGEVKPQLGKYTVAGYVKASVWWDDDKDRRHGVEGYFPEELIGVRFIVGIAPDFVS